MFLRYMTILLLFGFVSLGAMDTMGDKQNPNIILASWCIRKAKGGEYTALNQQLFSLTDFWKENEADVFAVLPDRGALCNNIEALSQQDTPNKDNLIYLATATRRHHQQLLSTNKKLGNDEMVNAIQQAFPDLNNESK